MKGIPYRLRHPLPSKSVCRRKGCEMAAAARFLERSGNYAGPRMTMTSRYSADIARSCASCLSSQGMGFGWLRRGGGRRYKRERAWRGAAAPRISHLYPCPAYIARGDNSTRAPGTVSLHGFPGYNILGYLASRPRGLEIPTLRVTVGPPSSRRSPTTPSRNDGGNCRRVYAGRLDQGKWPIPGRDLIILLIFFPFFFFLPRCGTVFRFSDFIRVSSYSGLLDFLNFRWKSESLDYR